MTRSTLGSLGGYLRTFVDEEERLATLLRHASARISHRDYVKAILAEIGQFGGRDSIESVGYAGCAQ